MLCVTRLDPAKRVDSLETVYMRKIGSFPRITPFGWLSLLWLDAILHKHTHMLWILTRKKKKAQPLYRALFSPIGATALSIEYLSNLPFPFYNISKQRTGNCNSSFRFSMIKSVPYFAYLIFKSGHHIGCTWFFRSFDLNFGCWTWLLSL